MMHRQSHERKEEEADVTEPSTADELVAWLNEQGPEREMSAMTGWLLQKIEERWPVRVLKESLSDDPAPGDLDGWLDRIQAALSSLPEGTRIPDGLPDKVKNRMRRECEALIEAKERGDYSSAMERVLPVVRLHGIRQHLEEMGGRPTRRSVGARAGSDYTASGTMGGPSLSKIRRGDELLTWLSARSSEQAQGELLAYLVGQQRFLRTLESPPSPVTDAWLNQVETALASRRSGKAVPVASTLLAQLQRELQSARENLLVLQQRGDYEKALAQAPRFVRLHNIVQRLAEATSQETSSGWGSQSRVSVPDPLPPLNGLSPERDLEDLSAWLLDKAKEGKTRQLLTGPLPALGAFEERQWLSKVETALSQLGPDASIEIQANFANGLRNMLKQACRDLFAAVEKGDERDALIHIPRVARLHHIAWRVERITETQTAHSTAERVNQIPETPLKAEISSAHAGSQASAGARATHDVGPSRDPDNAEELYIWLAKKPSTSVLQDLTDWSLKKIAKKRNLQVLTIPPPQRITDEWLCKVEAAVSNLTEETVIRISPDTQDKLKNELQGACRKLIEAQQKNEYEAALAQVPVIVRLYDLVQGVQKFASPQNDSSEPQWDADVAPLLNSLDGLKPQGAIKKLTEQLLQKARESGLLQTLNNVPPQPRDDMDMHEWVARIEGTLWLLPKETRASVSSDLSTTLQDWLKHTCSELVQAKRDGEYLKALNQMPLVIRLHGLIQRIDGNERPETAGTGATPPKPVSYRAEKLPEASGSHESDTTQQHAKHAKRGCRPHLRFWSKSRNSVEDRNP